jgi:hypothetical protein
MMSGWKRLFKVIGEGHIQNTREEDGCRCRARYMRSSKTEGAPI